MASIHVRGVSDDTLATLNLRAERSGQSLQGYVRQLLEQEAATLTSDEAVARIRATASQSSVTVDDVLDAIADMRDARS